MSTVSKSFTAVGVGNSLTLRPGESLSYAVSGTFVGTVQLERLVNSSSAAAVIVAAITAAASGTYRNDTFETQNVRFQCTAFTSGTIVTSVADVTNEKLFSPMPSDWKTPDGVQVFRITEEGIEAREVKGDAQGDADFIGAVNAATGLSCTIRRQGRIAFIDFTFTALSLTVTDAAGSGSSASLKIFDFAEGAVIPLASRQDYTAFAEGAALTGAAGDAAFVMAFGSVAANAGDGALTGTEVDIAPATGTITLSGGTGTGTKMGGATAAPIDGTTTPVDIFLNWSGSAATIDANSTISVTGTATIMVAMLGDD